MTEWLDPDIEIPANPDEIVLVMVTGKYRNVVFDRAFLLGIYSDDEGWILEQYPEWEKPNITHWMPLPEAPKEDEKDENA